MAIDVTAWAVSRERAISFMEAVGIATRDAEFDYLVPSVDVHLYPSNPDEVLVVLDKLGNVRPGWYCNVRYYGNAEAALTEGLTPFNEDGTFKTLWERSHVKAFVEMRLMEPLVWKPKDDKPMGYETLDGGIRLYDPSLIKTPSSVWA